MKKGKELMRRVLCIVLVCAIILTLTPDSFMNIRQAEAAQEKTPEKITEKEYLSGGCTIKYQTKSAWGNQAAIDIVVQNNGTDSMKLSEIRFAYAAKITSIWNAAISSQKVTDGMHEYVLKPESYSRLINAGESITVGFIAEGADTPQAPEQISVTGQRETEQDMSGDMADFGGCCRVSTEISNAWNGSMIGKIILKNTGNETIKGWNLHFAWQGKITSMWNASYEGDETGYTIRPMDYNNEIKPGDQVEIGFQASGEEKELEEFGRKGFIHSQNTYLSAANPPISMTPSVSGTPLPQESQFPVLTPSREPLKPQDTQTPLERTPDVTDTLPAVTPEVSETPEQPESTERSTVQPEKTILPTETVSIQESIVPICSKVPEIPVVSVCPGAAAEVTETPEMAVTQEPMPTQPIEDEVSVGDYYVNGSIVLEEDLVCDNLYIHGKLYTNGKKLTVKKNIIQEGSGLFFIQNSQVSVKESYILSGGEFCNQGDSVLEITGDLHAFPGVKISNINKTEEDIFTLKINGSFLFEEEEQVTHLHQTNIILGGDFKQDTDILIADPKMDESIRITFVGKKMQTVDVQELHGWRFGTLDARKAKCVQFTERAECGIHAVNLYGMSHVNTPSEKNIYDVENIYVENCDETLSKDTRIENGTLKIIGAKLTAEGDFKTFKERVVMTEAALLVEGKMSGISSCVCSDTSDIMIKKKTRMSSGTFIFSGQCTFECKQDVEINGGGFYSSQGFVQCVINGNFIQDGHVSIKEGEIHFKGDYIFNGYKWKRGDYIEYGKKCRVCFCGDRVQKVSTKDHDGVYWGQLDFSRSKGVCIQDILVGYSLDGVDKIKSEKETLSLYMDIIHMDQDTVVEGDLELQNSRLEINEGSLHIKGSLKVLGYKVRIESEKNILIDGNVEGGRELEILLMGKSPERKKFEVGGEFNATSGYLTEIGNTEIRLQGNVNIKGSFSIGSWNKNSGDWKSEVYINRDLNFYGGGAFCGDGTVYLKGDYYQKYTKRGDSSFGGNFVFTSNKNGTHRIEADCKETIHLGSIDLRDAGNVYISNTMLSGTEITGLDRLICKDGDLKLYMNQWLLKQDEQTSGNLVLFGGCCILNGHSLTVNGNLSLECLKNTETTNDSADIRRKKRMFLQASETNHEVIKVKKNLILENGDIQFGGLLDLNIGQNFYIKGTTTVYSIDSWNWKNKDQMTCYLAGDLIQPLSSAENPIANNERFTVVMNGQNQRISLPSVSKLGNLDISQSKNVNLDGNIYGNTLTGVENLAVQEGEVKSYFDKNVVSSDKTVQGSLYCSGDLLLQNHTLHLMGDYEQNGNTDIIQGELQIDGDYRAKSGKLTIGKGHEQKNKVYVKQNTYIRKNASVEINSGENRFCVDGDLLVATAGHSGENLNRWSGGILELKGDLKTNSATYDENLHFRKTAVILNGKKPQKINTKKSHFAVQWNNLDMHQAKKVHFTNPIIYAENGMSGFDKIENQTITLKNSRISLTGNEEYEGEIVFINSIVNMENYAFHVKGNADMISSIVYLEGGIFHTEGLHFVGRSILQMNDSNALLWVEGDFSMKSTLNHQRQLTNGRMKLTGDFLQEGDNCSFATSNKFTIAFVGNTTQRVHFDDEVNSKFANVDPAYADYQMDDTTLYMTTRLSYHIAVGIAQGFRELLGNEEYSKYALELLAGFGITVVFTAITLPEAALLIAGQVMLMMSGIMCAYMAVSAVEGLYDASSGTGGIYEKAEQFAKNSTILIVNIFGAFMSAKELVQNLSSNMDRFTRILQRQEKQTVPEIIEEQRFYSAEQYANCNDALNGIKSCLEDQETEKFLQQKICNMDSDQWRDVIEMLQKCRKETKDTLDKDDLQHMLDAMEDGRKDVAEYVGANKKARIYETWAKIKDDKEFNRYALEIGRKDNLKISERVEMLQQLFKTSPYKQDMHVPKDAKYVKGFTKEGYPVYYWPEKFGFKEAKAISRENMLPETWDRYGGFRGKNFADVPKTGKYDYNQRALPYAKNEAAYHTGIFNNKTYFDKIDAIRDNDIEKLNQILAKEDVVNINAEDFEKIRNDYEKYIQNVQDELPEMDAPYGLSGEAAQMMDLEGGANQFMTPLKGNFLKQLGILKKIK